MVRKIHLSGGQAIPQVVIVANEVVVVNLHLVQVGGDPGQLVR
jgi:hypothetical protein